MNLDEAVATEVLRALAVQIRRASLDQIARAWFSQTENPEATARHTLTKLLRGGLVEQATIEVRRSEAATRPLFKWQPGWSDPARAELEELAEELDRRWSDTFDAIEVYFASRTTANLFGITFVGVGKPCEWSHDHRITDVYSSYRQLLPEAVARWKGESAFPKYGKHVRRVKDPDAFLCDAEGRIQQVIEVAGRYSASHLMDFHRHCAGGGFERLAAWEEQRGLALSRNPYALVEIGYELW